MASSLLLCSLFLLSIPVSFSILHSLLGHLVTMGASPRFFSPPSLNMKMIPAALRRCWEEEGRAIGRQETRGEERRGGRKEGNKGRGKSEKNERERERGRGGFGCSCSCGPGGELPSPGCSAETSMGGCVGSHHDSSGSLNENSDGTGGNLRGSSAPFTACERGF